MTQDQTRQLGVEFERRVQLMYPNSQFGEKLDTDTIYAMLNEYQLEYVKALFVAEDQIQPGTRSATKLSDSIKSIVRRSTLIPDSEHRDVNSDEHCDSFKLPEDYFYYVRSNSLVDRTYKHPQTEEGKSYPVPNILIRQSDVSMIISTTYNRNNIIRNPLVILDYDQDNYSIKVIHDNYTHIDKLDLVYYRRPYNFNVIGYNDEDVSENAVHSYCELPYQCFEDLVSGAVLMYMTKYKFGLQSGQNDKKQEEPKKEEDKE